MQLTGDELEFVKNEVILITWSLLVSMFNTWSILVMH